MENGWALYERFIALKKVKKTNSYLVERIETKSSFDIPHEWVLCSEHCRMHGEIKTINLLPVHLQIKVKDANWINFNSNLISSAVFTIWNLFDCSFLCIAKRVYYTLCIHRILYSTLFSSHWLDVLNGFFQSINFFQFSPKWIFLLLHIRSKKSSFSVTFCFVDQFQNHSIK